MSRSSVLSGSLVLAGLLVVTCAKGQPAQQQGPDARTASPTIASTATTIPATSATVAVATPGVATTTTAPVLPVSSRAPATAGAISQPTSASVVLVSQATLCGPTRTTGTVRNEGGTQALGASVIARIFTSAGTLVTIAEARTSPSTIPAGGSASFDAQYRTDPCDSVVLRRGWLGYKGDVVVNWANGSSAPIPLALQ